jgi:DNA polymerase-4
VEVNDWLWILLERMGQYLHMLPKPRAIVHLDLDAFFAAVEVQENPDLVGKPVIVGGQPGGRGVVASASYPARAFGVRSAMPTSRALALCPQAIVLPARHRLYRDYSRRVMEVLHQTAPLVEQMSVDEAFLDLTNQVETWEAVIEVAQRLQRRVKEEIGLSASLGVATNKLVAKVASDREKPGGLTVVRPGAEAAFLAPLPVRVLWGVGPVTAQKLAGMKVTTVGELARVPEDELRARFGQQGAAMARQVHGIDERPLVTAHEPKSVSRERTFAHDLVDADALEEHLWRMSKGVGRRLKRATLAAGTVAIKVRYADFTTLTRQMTLSVPTDDEEEIYRAALTLLRRVWQRGRPVRLLGVAGRQLSPPVGQLPLFMDEDQWPST